MQQEENVTLFVSATSFPVGSVVCQIAKTKGCYMIGSAGSKEKVTWLINDSRIDYAFNYKLTNGISTDLQKALPSSGGIDLYSGSL